MLLLQPSWVNSAVKIANGRTAVALYLGPHEIERITEEINTNWDALAADGTIDAKQATAIGKTLIKEFSDVASAADIALFGRMVAETTDLNIDASCQVAHAISTHRAQMEMDFFTAVDDLQPDSEPGAGMMGTVEFNSSCFYRYSLLDCDQLTGNLDSNPDLATRTVDAFIRASVAAIPSARQNSMAAQNPPSFVMAVVRESGTPWSLANAFQRPVYISPRDQQGLIEKSLDALDDYWGRLCAVYGTGGIVSTACCWLDDVDATNLKAARVESLEDLYAQVNAAVAAGNGGE